MVELSHWSIRWMAQMTCFRPRKCVLGVRMMSDVIWGKYSPKTPQKGAWIGSFKPKRQNLYIAISPELLIRRTSDLRTEFRPWKALRGWSAILKNGNDVIFLQWVLQLGRNSVAWCRMTWELREVVDIKTGSTIAICRTFVVESQSSIEICRRNLVCS